MKNEEQRIAIAEACGWHGFTTSAVDGRALGCSPTSGKFRITVPDYLNDLNAMREVEESLTTEQRKGDHYAAKIADVTGCDDMLFAFIHATAAQRAEAFLRVKGLWKQDEPTPAHQLDRDFPRLPRHD